MTGTDTMIDSKARAAERLDIIIKRDQLSIAAVGREITGDPNFIHRLRDPVKTITTKTLDLVWQFILEQELEETKTLRNRRKRNK